MKKAYFQLHIAVFLAGFTAILGKLIQLNEGSLVWYRLALTIIIMAGWFTFSGLWKKVAGRTILQLMGVGAVITFHWVAFYGSIKYANVSVALVCFSATGFFTALLEPLILRKKFVLAEVMLGLLSVLGIYIIFDFHPQYTLGIVYGIAAAIGSAVFPILNKQLLKKCAPQTMTFYEMAGGFIFLTIMLPFYLSFLDVQLVWPAVMDWFWLLILAGFCTVLTLILQLNALKHISAFTSNLTYNLEPFYGIMMAFVIFNETKMLHPGFYAGLALILVSIILQMVRVRNQQTGIQPVSQD